MKRRWLGSLIAVVALLALVGLAWYLIERPSDKPAGPGGPGGGGGRGGSSVTVGEAVVRKADIPVQLDALGTVTPIATIAIKPQVAGELQRVFFSEGQLVKKGQLLAKIDPRPFQAALQQAQGNRARDQAQLENARLTLQRYRTLLSQDSIARQDVDTQAALVRQLEGTIMSGRAAEESARLNVENSDVRAPLSGRIGLRSVDQGNNVSTADTIATIAQITPIDVQFSVPQDRVPEVQPSAGQSAQLPVTVWDRTRSTQLGTGTFATLDNLIDTTTGTVKAKARFANAAGNLFPNQFVNVQLLLRVVEGALVVPVTALRTGVNGDFVYVINADRTVAMRSVKRGEATADLIAVTSGLKEGERVVTEGGDRLKDGARVQLQGDRPAGGASGARGARERASGASGEEGRARRRASDSAGEGEPRRGGEGRAGGGQRATP